MWKLNANLCPCENGGTLTASGHLTPRQVITLLPSNVSTVKGYCAISHEGKCGCQFRVEIYMRALQCLKHSHEHSQCVGSKGLPSCRHRSAIAFIWSLWSCDKCKSNIHKPFSSGFQLFPYVHQLAATLACQLFSVDEKVPVAAGNAADERENQNSKLRHHNCS